MARLLQERPDVEKGLFEVVNMVDTNREVPGTAFLQGCVACGDGPGVLPWIAGFREVKKGASRDPGLQDRPDEPDDESAALLDAENALLP
ncbi:hypothetical protein ACWD26_01670 [Streptomyces sp. NPDC002787]